MTIVDPHIKRVSSYHVHDQAESWGYFVKDADKKDFEGWCWPGTT